VNKKFSLIAVIGFAGAVLALVGAQPASAADNKVVVKACAGADTNRVAVGSGELVGYEIQSSSLAGAVNGAGFILGIYDFGQKLSTNAAYIYAWTNAVSTPPRLTLDPVIGSGTVSRVTLPQPAKFVNGLTVIVPAGATNGAYSLFYKQ
jgi:hypothetical protein